MTTASPDIAEFTRLPGDRRSEVSRTLVEPVPQALSFIDQLGLWGNLGVSLLGFTGAAAATLLVGFLPLPGRSRGTGAAQQATGQPAR